MRCLTRLVVMPWSAMFACNALAVILCSENAIGIFAAALLCSRLAVSMQESGNILIYSSCAKVNWI